VYSQQRLQHAVELYAREIGPVDPTAYAPKPVPEAENLAVWLNAGVSAFVISQPDRTLVSELVLLPVESWDPAKKAKLKVILDRNEPAIQVLMRAMDKISVRSSLC
jgi:hypothetical protein